MLCNDKMSTDTPMYKKLKQMYDDAVMYKEMNKDTSSYWVDLYSEKMNQYLKTGRVTGLCSDLGMPNRCFCGKCSCFGKGSMVWMEDGSKKQIEDLVKGDALYGGGKVVCLVEYQSRKPIEMSKVGTLYITPWHPIKNDDKWVFPYYYSNIICRMIGPVYNLVLDQVHIATIEGVPCCTLGHGFEGPIIGHKYFGTQKVIDDLSKEDGWDDGKVTFVDIRYMRDKFGVVSGFQYAFVRPT